MREVNPMDTDRAKSWQLYIDAPMPMVTIFKTLDISNLLKPEKAGYKLNMLLCYCICLAANDTKEFHLLPVGKKMMPCSLFPFMGKSIRSSPIAVTSYIFSIFSPPSLLFIPKL